MDVGGRLELDWAARGAPSHAPPSSVSTQPRNWQKDLVINPGRKEGVEGSIFCCFHQQSCPGQPRENVRE